MSLLEGRDLAVVFRGSGGGPAGEEVRALAGVDVALAAGELVAVLGPNGSGKSTLLRVLGGVLTPERGTVEALGQPLRELRPRERARRIAVVPQALEALPDVDVEGFVLGGRYPFVGTFGRVRDGDREAVERALAEADALPWRARRLAELSGGQRQRVLVARALAQEAPLLLLDEPTAALDPEHQVRLFELFRALVHGAPPDAPRAALVATHELAIAGRYADRLLVLDGGRLVADGPPERVLTPEVLVPVYGPALHFGAVEEGGRRRPLVVPWPPPERAGGPRGGLGTPG